ncbi:MAG: 6-phosphogluconolactonase [Myxococcaceae bacterium]|nr:6-phosphogluconolactonase [Myxococcaceae bacterium]
MKKLACITVLCALGTTACNSSKDMGENTQDASDAAQGMSNGDAAARDSSVKLDANAAQDAATAGDAQLSAADASSASSDGAVSAGDAGVVSTVLTSFVYVGGYGNPYPFRTYALDRATGALQEQGSPQLTMGENPSFIAPSADHGFLYIANEPWVGNEPGVTVASIATTGAATKLELQPAAGPLVFTSLDPQGKYVLAASYNNGFVDVFPIKPDHTLDPVVDSVPFTKPGGGDPQTHSIRVHPSGKWAYAPNLGLDKVAQFSFDESTGKLKPLSPPFVNASKGPRHIAFNNMGSFAFVITELSSELISFRVGDNGLLTEVDRKSALPAGQAGDKGAHVLVHPKNDAFVYASNRTDNSIAVFSVAADGKVTQIQTLKTGGAIPRNFDIDSEGKYLIAANTGESGKANGSLVVFAIGDDGKLTQRGALITGLEQPAAVSIVTLGSP